MYRSKTAHQLVVVLVLACAINTAVYSYKLNVPKVLLPFHSSKLISFTLEAKSETDSFNEDICFTWSSSRPDVVTITPIYTDSRSKCSNKAIVSAVSKHPQRLTSIIFAHEPKTDKLIRCDVIVDQINTIRIKHTTTHLYLEDSPECFTAEALDDEGNTFSSIDGLAFEWSILNDNNDEASDEPLALDSRNVLKISKFIESEYEVSDSIRQLESVGLTGHKILIEGLKTGQANVQAKLVDPFYKATVLKSPVVRLLVVANLLLEPSYPVYLVPGAEIKYTVSLIKQHSVERISLPGSQYYFESRNSTIADLVRGEKTQSIVVGKHLGTTDVVLIDRNMKEEMLMHTQRNSGQTDQLVVPPPSATIHVVTPDHLVFSIKNWRSWILEVGRRYEIVIQVVSNQRMQIYSSDNLVIESQFDSVKFAVNHQSPNGSYNYVGAREKGITVARASLRGTRALITGEIAEFEWIARGEQEIELLDPIEVIPKILIFALTQSTQSSGKDQLVISSAYEYRLAASGGSGTYYWQSKNTTIASVSAQGLVKTTATKLGQTVVAVTDVRNTDIQAKSIVYVLEPIDLAVQACPVETQVGTKLYLNVQMNAYVPTSSNSDASNEQPSATIMPITDCSRLPFDVSIQDESVFKLVSIQSPTSTSSHAHHSSDACAVVVLDSLRPGRTTIKLTYSPSSLSSSSSSGEVAASSSLVSNDMQIGSYSMLRSHKTLITLARDSSLVVNLYDGPLFSSIPSLSSSSPYYSSSNDAVHAASSSLGGGYQSDVTVSDRGELLEIVALDHESHHNAAAQPNRYSYRVKCASSRSKTRADNDAAAAAAADILVKFSLAHKKTAANKCPLAFDYKLKVRCVEPSSLELSQLFVNNDENTGNVLSTMKWKCPIKLSSHFAAAHVDRPLYVQLTARDSLGNVFDNFTSLKTQWHIGDRALLDRSSRGPHSDVESLEVAALDDSTLVLLDPREDLPNSNRVFFQRFETRKVLGDTKVTVKMFLPNEGEKTQEHDHEATSQRHLSSSLSVHFVSDVRIDPNTLTVFNHPSNIIPLALSRGSGHYHAEIETVQNHQQQTSANNAESLGLSSSSLSAASVLKINQITESSVVVSPSANNGLTYLHVYDYCVPPPSPNGSDQSDDQSLAAAMARLPPSIYNNRVMTWPPYATAKIQVAGINSILVNYEDDKVEVKSGLKIFVQISDATGNLIRTKYFPLMNLKAKLANVETTSSSTSSGQSGSASSKQESSSSSLLSLATIELDQNRAGSAAQSDEFTAVYVLNAVKTGVVSIQFEAQSDGQTFDSTSNNNNKNKPNALDNLIHSGVKEIQIFSPLRVQPKYIELIRGAQYQVSVSGGPVSLDAVISYEIEVLERKVGHKSSTESKIIEINSNKGVIDALELGKVKVIVKSIGYACQPFSPKAATQSPPPPSRCTSESKIARVYSQDSLVVNVVELLSVQIHTPLGSIKRGNEMPVYLMANKKSLSALNFASSPSLKYQWRINDRQIAGLYHPLIDDSSIDSSSSLSSSHSSSSSSANSAGDDDENSRLFERAFSLRLLARQAGTVKISVRVDFLNAKNQPTSLTDSIDIVVFEEAQFTHFAPAYYLFKHPSQLATSSESSLLPKTPSSKSASSSSLNTHQLLMSPGTQLQVRTNFDNLATKLTYEIKFYKQQATSPLEHTQSSLSSSSSSSSSVIASYCSNATVRVNDEGVITAAAIKHSQLKYFQECTATLLVTIQMAGASGPDAGKSATSGNKPLPSKQQTLAYTIRVKPVVYAMLKLNKNSIAKLTESVKFRLSRQSLVKNRLELSSSGVQMKWHVRYYDNLGDMFDVVHTNNQYTVNRNDLVDFSNINSNLFELSAESHQQHQQRQQQVEVVSTIGSDRTGSSDSPSSSSPSASSSSSSNADDSLSSSSGAAATIVANAVENSFTLRTTDRGVFVMELSPVAASRRELSRDYIGLNIGGGEFESAGGEFDSIGGRSRLDVHVGDLICLSRLAEQESIDQDLNNDESSTKRDHLELETQWVSQLPHVVKLVSSTSSPIQIGVCLTPGQSTLRKSMPPPHDSLLGLVEVTVRPVDRVMFLTRSDKFMSNARASEASNQVQFQIKSTTLTGQNCSGEFASALAARTRGEQEQLNPFRCWARFYNEQGGHLVYLDRLVNTVVSFEDQHWTCELKFAPESEALVYNLVENHIDRPVSGFKSAQQSEDSSREYEPVQIRIQIDSKVSENLLDSDSANSPRILSLPFIPAFYTATKQIELSVLSGSQRIRRTVGSDSATNIGDTFQLVVRATHSIRSHLIVTSNLPSLIKIKPYDGGSSASSSSTSRSATSATRGSATSTDSISSSILSVAFDVSVTDEIYDLNAFTSLLQQAKGEIYVQVTCSSTQQIEKIPIRFVFGGLTAADAIRYHDYRSRTVVRPDYPFWYNPLGYILDSWSSQFSSFLVLFLIGLLTILAIMRLKPQSSASAQQMAANAQAAAAALAYQQRGSPKDYSSFNPYRYFSSSLDQVPTDLNRSTSGHSPGKYRRVNQNESYYGTPMRSAVFSGSGGSPSSSPSKPPVERDSIRLFSTDANVMLRSPGGGVSHHHQHDQQPANLSFRNVSRHYNEYSDND